MRFQNPKKLSVCLVILALLSIPPLLHSFRLIPSLNLLFFNFTYSAPRGVYVTAWDQRIQVGDYLILVPPEEWQPYLYGRQWTTAKYLLKRVAALPGSKYRITDNWMMMDDHRAYIFDKDPDNLPLPHLVNGDYDVPENNFLLVSWDVANSFDSRYFGPVNSKFVKKKVLPLLVLPQFH